MRNKKIVENYDIMGGKLRDLNSLTGRYFNSKSPLYMRRLANEILARLSINKDDTVLDFGCSVGLYHKYLFRQCKRLIGIDASQNLIKIARATNSKQIEYLVGDGTDFSYGFRVNKVLIYSVIHFLDDLDSINSLISNIVAHRQTGKPLYIYLGEVRDHRMYTDYRSKRENRSIVRDILFSIFKLYHSFQVRGLKLTHGIDPLLVSSEDIHQLARRHSAEVQVFNQSSFHPFSNTCVDYLLIIR